LCPYRLCLAAYRGVRGAHPPLALWEPAGTPLALPLLIFAFTGHSSLFPCLAKMRAPTVGRATLLLRHTMLAAAVIYACVGVGGYTIFRDRTAARLSQSRRVLALTRAAGQHLAKLFRGGPA